MFSGTSTLSLGLCQKASRCLLYRKACMMRYLIGWHTFCNQLNDRQAHSCTVQAKPILLQLEDAILSSRTEDSFQMNHLAYRHHHYAKKKKNQKNHPAQKTCLFRGLFRSLPPPFLSSGGLGQLYDIILSCTAHYDLPS